MPCDTNLKQGETLVDRQRTVKESLDRLRRELASGRVRVRIAPSGAVAFDGWKPDDRSGVTDVCAYRTLAAQNSPELRQAVARAEYQQGRKVDERAVAAGTHSHDGGVTWHKGH